MKKLLLGLTLMTSMSSFAVTYNGEGITDENGTEQCAMEVVELENNNLDITVFGNGLVAKSIIEKSPEIDFTTYSEDLPSEAVNVFAVMNMDNQTKPVSFQLTSKDGMIECNF